VILTKTEELLFGSSLGSEQIPVEAELGELTPAVVPQWGGLLRGAPEPLAAAMRSGQDARLRWPDRQERRVRLGGERLVDDHGRLIVAFLGVGRPRPGGVAGGARPLRGRGRKRPERSWF
jgi:hypothetical protein